jgi:hypothetical protein
MCTYIYMYVCVYVYICILKTEKVANVSKFNNATE